MGFLDGLARAGLQAYAGYERGQIAGEQDRLRREQLAAEAKRQQEMDAVRSALMRAQIDNYQSESAKRAQPVMPAGEIRIDGSGRLGRVLPDNTFVPITGAQPRPIVPRTTSQARPLTAGQSRTAQQQEAEGLAYMGSNALRGNPAGRNIQAQFGQAFQAIRAAHPDWTPGRVAYAAKQGMAKIPAPKANDFPSAPAPEQVGDASVTAARDLVKGLDPAHAASVLKDAGYGPDEIRAILGQ